MNALPVGRVVAMASLLLSCGPAARPDGLLVPWEDTGQALPLAGGTLLVTQGGLAIASDPDRAAIWIVQPHVAVVGAIASIPGDEPGRLAEDADGRVHVALRGSGEVLSFDPDDPSVVSRRPVCAGPRGIAFDEQRNALHVACVRGELVTIPLDGAPERRVLLDDDLRDVVPDVGGKLWVSRFRSAEVLLVDEEGAIVARHRPVLKGLDPALEAQAAVAWRMVPVSEGRVVLTFQLARPGLSDNPPVPSPTKKKAPPYYGPVETAQPGKPKLVPMVTPALAVFRLEKGDVVQEDLIVDVQVNGPLSLDVVGGGGGIFVVTGVADDGEIEVGIAGSPAGGVYRQTRTRVAGVKLPFQPVDEGSRDFHAGPGIACASCHPEGRDDGVVWRFGAVQRRTQSLSGDVTGTAPFHWKGDLPNLGAFMTVVMVQRMGRPQPSVQQIASMKAFLARIPKLPAPSDLDGRLARVGQRLFESEEVGCAACHSGPQLADGSEADVGTGESFQVPRLVDVSGRAPFLHDGCAPTLFERFTDPACGGGDLHGTTSQLSKHEIAALVEYLRSL